MIFGYVPDAAISSFNKAAILLIRQLDFVPELKGGSCRNQSEKSEYALTNRV